MADELLGSDKKVSMKNIVYYFMVNFQIEFDFFGI